MKYARKVVYRDGPGRDLKFKYRDVNTGLEVPEDEYDDYRVLSEGDFFRILEEALEEPEEETSEETPTVSRGRSGYQEKDDDDRQYSTDGTFKTDLTPNQRMQPGAQQGRTTKAEENTLNMGEALGNPDFKDIGLDVVTGRLAFLGDRTADKGYGYIGDEMVERIAAGAGILGITLSTGGVGGLIASGLVNFNNVQAWNSAVRDKNMGPESEIKPGSLDWFSAIGRGVVHSLNKHKGITRQKVYETVARQAVTPNAAGVAPKGQAEFPNQPLEPNAQTPTGPRASQPAFTPTGYDSLEAMAKASPVDPLGLANQSRTTIGTGGLADIASQVGQIGVKNATGLDPELVSYAQQAAIMTYGPGFTIGVTSGLRGNNPSGRHDGRAMDHGVYDANGTLQIDPVKGLEYAQNYAAIRSGKPIGIGTQVNANGKYMGAGMFHFDIVGPTTKGGILDAKAKGTPGLEFWGPQKTKATLPSSVHKAIREAYKSGNPVSAITREQVTIPAARELEATFNNSPELQDAMASLAQTRPTLPETRMSATRPKGPPISADGINRQPTSALMSQPKPGFDPTQPISQPKPGFDPFEIGSALKEEMGAPTGIVRSNEEIPDAVFQAKRPQGAFDNELGPKPLNTGTVAARSFALTPEPNKPLSKAQGPSPAFGAAGARGGFVEGLAPVNPGSPEPNKLPDDLGAPIDQQIQALKAKQLSVFRDPGLRPVEKSDIIGQLKDQERILDQRDTFGFGGTIPTTTFAPEDRPQAPKASLQNLDVNDIARRASEAFGVPVAPNEIAKALATAVAEDPNATTHTMSVPVNRMTSEQYRNEPNPLTAALSDSEQFDAYDMPNLMSHAEALIQENPQRLQDAVDVLTGAMPPSSFTHFAAKRDLFVDQIEKFTPDGLTEELGDSVFGAMTTADGRQMEYEPVYALGSNFDGSFTPASYGEFTDLGNGMMQWSDGTETMTFPNKDTLAANSRKINPTVMEITGQKGIYEVPMSMFNDMMANPNDLAGFYMSEQYASPEEMQDALTGHSKVSTFGPPSYFNESKGTYRTDTPIDMRGVAPNPFNSRMFTEDQQQRHMWDQQLGAGFMPAPFSDREGLLGRENRYGSAMLMSGLPAGYQSGMSTSNFLAGPSLQDQMETQRALAAYMEDLNAFTDPVGREWVGLDSNLASRMGISLDPVSMVVGGDSGGFSFSNYGSSPTSSGSSYSGGGPTGSGGYNGGGESYGATGGYADGSGSGDYGTPGGGDSYGGAGSGGSSSDADQVSGSSGSYGGSNAGGSGFGAGQDADYGY